MNRYPQLNNTNNNNNSNSKNNVLLTFKAAVMTQERWRSINDTTPLCKLTREVKEDTEK